MAKWFGTPSGELINLNKLSVISIEMNGDEGVVTGVYVDYYGTENCLLFAGTAEECRKRFEVLTTLLKAVHF